MFYDFIEGIIISSLWLMFSVEMAEDKTLCVIPLTFFFFSLFISN